jgi:hypothetical protein
MSFIFVAGAVAGCGGDAPGRPVRTDRRLGHGNTPSPTSSRQPRVRTPSHRSEWIV